jgi:hypothetical protein
MLSVSIDGSFVRFLALAHKAFRDLPDEYVTKQVVIKLCQGCIDKNIGSVAASFQPKTVEGALERIKWFLFGSLAVFGLTFSKALFNYVLLLCSNLLTSV